MTSIGIAALPKPDCSSIEREKRICTTFDNVPYITYCCTSDGTVEFISSGIKELSGYAAEEFVGNSVRSLSSIIHPDDRAGVLEEKLQALPRGYSYVLEYRIIDRLAQIHWVIEKGQGTPSDDQEQIRLDGVIIDITSRKDVEELLRESELRLHNYNTQLRRLAGELSFTEARERRNFATILHDRIGQELSFIRFRVRQIAASSDQNMSDVLQSLDQLIFEARGLTFEMSTPVLYDLGLEKAFEWLCDHVQQRYGITCTFSESGGPLKLNSEENVLLYQCTRELVFNAVKHGEPRNISISIARGSMLRIDVVDDGKGIQKVARFDRRAEKADGIGLFSVRERLFCFKGSLQIAPGKNGGTHASICCPIIGKS